MSSSVVGGVGGGGDLGVRGDVRGSSGGVAPFGRGEHDDGGGGAASAADDGDAAVRCVDLSLGKFGILSRGC